MLQEKDTSHWGIPYACYINSSPKYGPDANESNGGGWSISLQINYEVRVQAITFLADW